MFPATDLHWQRIFQPASISPILYSHSISIFTWLCSTMKIPPSFLFRSADLDVFWATQKPWIEVAIAPCDRPSCQTNAWPGSQAGTDILMGLPFGNLTVCYWKWMKIAHFAVDLPLKNMCFISNYLAWFCHPKSAWTSNNWEQGRWIFSCKNEYHLFMNGLWFVVAWCYLVYKDTSDFIAPFWETSTVLVTDIEES